MFSIIVIAILFPIVVHVCYKIGSPCPFLVAEWGAGDMLAYGGAVLGGMGTIVIGTISLYQNRILHNELRKQHEWSRWLELSASYKPCFCLENFISSVRCSRIAQDSKGIWRAEMPLREWENVSDEAAIQLKVRVANGIDIYRLQFFGKLFWYDDIPEGNMVFHHAEITVPKENRFTVNIRKKDFLSEGIRYLVFDCENKFAMCYRQVIPMRIRRSQASLIVYVFELPVAKLITKWEETTNGQVEI